jgi:hypothetical protein
MPYPWKELKVSEFASHGTYAPGFPTDITFSESIGFLADSDPRSRIAFMVAAHESAHQWWGNLLVPGEGPGGNILSEGMAHFSTILLTRKCAAARAHRVLQAHRVELRQRPPGRFGEAAGQDRRLARGRHDGHLRQGRLGVLDAAAPPRPRPGARRLPGLPAQVPPHARPSGAAGFRRDDARLRRRSEAYDAFTKQWFFEWSCRVRAHGAARARSSTTARGSVSVAREEQGHRPHAARSLRRARRALPRRVEAPDGEADADDGVQAAETATASTATRARRSCSAPARASSSRSTATSSPSACWSTPTRSSCNCASRRRRRTSDAASRPVVTHSKSSTVRCGRIPVRS